ncbi:PilN domain-containing protein [Vibrio sp. HN007]|uniref:PilN domain-containing protein n=1 Tax=Vibrio iocasae TaxID=3098914 RepID=UPI0035D4F03E
MMPNINFVPWREQHRARYRRLFWLMLVIVCISSVLIQFTIYHSLHQQALSVQDRVSRLQHSLEELKSTAEKLTQTSLVVTEINQRIQSTEALIQRQSLPQKLVNRIADLVPKNIYLKAISFEAGNVQVDATATEAEHISFFALLLQSHPEFKEVSVRSTTHVAKDELIAKYHFMISFAFDMEESN